jgi:hypothetical protein
MISNVGWFYGQFKGMLRGCNDGCNNGYNNNNNLQQLQNFSLRTREKGRLEPWDDST